MEQQVEAAPGTLVLGMMARMTLLPPVRAATRSQEQEWADERWGDSSNLSPQGPPSPHCQLLPRTQALGRHPEKEKRCSKLGLDGGEEPGAYTDPTACPTPEGLWLPLMQPVPCWQQVPKDTGRGARQGQPDRFSLELCSTRRSRAAGKVYEQ